MNLIRQYKLWKMGMIDITHHEEEIFRLVIEQTKDVIPYVWIEEKDNGYCFFINPSGDIIFSILNNKQLKVKSDGFYYDMIKYFDEIYVKKFLLYFIKNLVEKRFTGYYVTKTISWNNTYSFEVKGIEIN